MKELVIKVLKKALKKEKVELNDEEINNLLEVPPSPDMGDYAFPCFSFVDKLKQAPNQIALQIRSNIGNPPVMDFDDIQTAGPYINFFLNRKNLARKTVWEILTQKDKYGKINLGKRKHTMVEFAQPNTNKPLHLGHLRNISIGESVSRILEFNGEKVVRANINNDRGIHICKSMLAYQKWGKDKSPADKKLKSDHFVGEFYTMFNKKKTKKLEKEAQELLKKWEEGDEKTLFLWKIMNTWALRGFKETYKKFGIKFDVEYYESKIYKKGKKTILKGVKEGIFKKAKDGAIIIDLEEEGLGKKVLLRKDGTSVYITQDIALAELKFSNYRLDKSIHVVGSEQEHYFKTLFSILEKLNHSKDKFKHLSHGMVNLPEGKMKSREGNVVDADDIIEKVQELIKKELTSRKKLPKTELERRSLKIALAAIKYMLLKVDTKKDMVFNPKESISFEGDTGPYIQYSYARASSILKKTKNQDKFKVYSLEPKELELVIKLSQFPGAVSDSYRNLSPSVIANYSYQLAQIFNEFYHTCPVIGSKQEAFRLALVQAFRQILKTSSRLLGIEVIEKM